MADKNKPKNEQVNNKEKADIKVADGKNADIKTVDQKLSEQAPESRNGILFYILTVLAAFLIVVLVLGGTLFFVVRNNVNGIADNMRSDIEKIPIINLALPVLPDPEDEKNMTEEMVRSKYTELKEQNKQLQEKVISLTAQVDDTNNKITANDTNTELLKQQKATLESEKTKLTSEYNSLKKQFEDMSKSVALGDKDSFKNYFEKVDPQTAQKIYEEIIKEKKISDDAKKYVSIFETMDASASAPILEQMGTAKMNLIVEIMKNLKKETSAEILANMSTSFAAKVSEQLAKEFNLINGG